MTRTRSLPVVALAAAASYTTLLSWSRLAEHSASYLVPLFWLTLLVAALGVGLRALHLPRWLVPLLQALGLAWAVALIVAPLDALGGVVPTPASVTGVFSALNDAGVAAQQWAAPIPADVTDFAPLMIVTGALVIWLVDALACTVRNVPLAGLPLLAAFTAPVSLVDGVSWLTFVLASGSFAFLMVADQAERLAPWGRGATAGQTSGPGGLPTSSGTRVSDNQPHRVSMSALVPAAATIGAIGIGAAAFAPVLIPEGLALFDGNGNGNGKGDGVTITNPLIDLRRDLTRGVDEPLLILETDQPDPSYYRLTALEKFDGTAWRPGDRRIPESQRATGDLTPPPGLAPGTPQTPFTAQVTVTAGLHSVWLPAPYPPTSLEAPGDWRYDQTTLDVLNAEEEPTQGGLVYDLAGLDVEPTAEQLVNSGLPPTDIEVNDTKLPTTMPAYIEKLAQQVTQGATSPFERAVRLQNWFRRDGGFTYTLDRATGSGLDQLAKFLGTGPGSRRGYCEQFASAMALMARTLGLPARVAVGFLEPDRASNGRYVFSSYDLHAWPEIYFAGAGWTKFEPTPGDRPSSQPPSYTLGTVPQPTEAPSPTASASPGDPEPTKPTAAPTSRDANAAADAGSSVGIWLAGAAGVLVLVGLVLAPRTGRSLARRRRWSDGSAAERVEAAWAEVRCTALDLGLGWDDGATLRRRARGLLPALGGDPAAATALEGLVLLLERARYSRAGVADAGAAVERSQVVVAALLAASSPWQRRRATWLPRSLWGARRWYAGSSVGRSDRLDGLGGPGSGSGEEFLAGSGRRDEMSV